MFPCILKISADVKVYLMIKTFFLGLVAIFISLQVTVKNSLCLAPSLTYNVKSMHSVGERLFFMLADVISYFSG